MNAFLIYDWRLDFSGIEVLFQFSSNKHGLLFSANLVTEITHLPFNYVSWCLIFEGQTHSHNAAVFLFLSLVPNEKLWMVLVMEKLIIAKG